MATLKSLDPGWVVERIIPLPINRDADSPIKPEQFMWGPFQTREAAQAWCNTHRNTDAIYTLIHPLLRA